MHALLLCAAVQTSWQQICATAFTPIKFCYPHKHCNHQTPVQCCYIYTAALHCCIYTYADCLSHRGALSQHQPTATMPGTDYICCAMLLLCKTASQLDCTAAFTPMQIAFYTAALQVGISPQQPSLGKITSAVPFCCCAKQPFSRTALLHLHLCELPFTPRRVELASAHSNQAWERLYLLCHAAAVQDSPSAGLQCCIYTYANCLSHRGASSQHQPTATMPETDYICCATLLLWRTALLHLHLCELPFTPRRVELASAHSNQAWERLNLLCHAAAVQNSLTAGLHCCVYTYAFQTEAR